MHKRSGVFKRFLAAVAPVLILMVATGTAKADCNIGVFPSVLALTSFDGTFFYRASGTIFGVVQNNFCLIVQDGAATYDPLSASPMSSLPTPFDPWMFYDNGGFLPFEPFFTSGSVGFFSFNFTDGSVGSAYGIATLIVIPT